MCDWCKSEKIEEEFAAETDFDKDGTGIVEFNEVLLEGTKNMDHSKVVNETSNM